MPVSPWAACGITPHLTKGGVDKTEANGPLNPDNLQEVIDGTYGVVNEGGTGVRAALPGIEVCGKTGTAQVASNEFTKGKSDKDLKDNAWFVGFAPLPGAGDRGGGIITSTARRASSPHPSCATSSRPISTRRPACPPFGSSRSTLAAMADFVPPATEVAH